MTKQLLHGEVPPRYTWNAPSVFASNEAWEQEVIKVGEGLATVAKYPGHLADSAALLVEALEARDEFLRHAQVLTVYADMASAVDSND